MIGKSYDGTLANGVAATGVEGLKTIVPISAISAWYNYSRTGGVRHNTNYPAGLNRPSRRRPERAAGVNLPARRSRHLATRRGANADIYDDATSIGDGDAHGDINEFWRDRDYNKDAARSGRPSSRPTASRTTTSAWTTGHVVGRA